MKLWQREYSVRVEHRERETIIIMQIIPKVKNKTNIGDESRSMTHETTTMSNKNRLVTSDNMTYISPIDFADEIVLIVE